MTALGSGNLFALALKTRIEPVKSIDPQKLLEQGAQRSGLIPSTLLPERRIL